MKEQTSRNRIEKLMTELYKAVKEESSKDVVEFEFFMNCEGYNYSVQTRTPEELENAGISMRNVKGEFIK